MSGAETSEITTTDWLDKLTNSKIFKASLLWYKNARDVVKAVNRQYNLFMRGVRILNQELEFIEYMARKIERISSYRFDPNNFWESMFELEYMFDLTDELYTRDLEYFDYLIGYHREVYHDFMGFSLPDMGKSIDATRRIWGRLPDYYREKESLAKLPVTKITMSNEYTTSKGYRLAGASVNTVNRNAQSHQKNKQGLDKIDHSPVKYLQFQNSLYLDYLYEKIVHLDNYKQRIAADCQVLLTKASFEDLKSKNNEQANNSINGIN